MQHHQQQDLAAYLQRIGYGGELAPTLDTLRAVHRCHASAIAFENLTPLLGQQVRLDLPALLEKLVHGGRGGYCFEQNLLLRHMLTALGFQATGLAARVRWNVPDEVITARGHMLLRVDLGGEVYIADVGFGGLTLTAPLRLVPDIEQQTPHEPFRLVMVGPAYLLQARIGDTWKALYSFELQEQHQPDYEVTNWYLSNHPNSHFVTSLMAARPEADRRYALRNNQFTVHHLGGGSERRVLETAAELHRVLRECFRLRLPETPELERALERIAAMGEG